MKGKQLTSAAAIQRSKWYGTARWKRLRKRVLAAHPVCCICFKAPATQADHVRHREDNRDFWTWENLRGACAECNNRLGATDRHRRGGRSEQTLKGQSTAQGSTKNYFSGFKGISSPIDAASIAAKLLTKGD